MMVEHAGFFERLIDRGPNQALATCIAQPQPASRLTSIAGDPSIFDLDVESAACQSGGRSAAIVSSS